MIRDAGKMYNPKGKLQDAKAVIPDRSYAGVYHETIEFCKKNGAFDPTTMGSVPNVGSDGAGRRRIRLAQQDLPDPAQRQRARRRRSRQDAARARGRSRRHLARCQTKDAPVQDWVKLAVNRARASGDAGRVLARQERAHDARADRKVEQISARSRHRRPGHPRSCRRRRPRGSRWSESKGQGHDFGDRQRAARLSHRSVPDPRSRYQREDALHRAADERRRSVRDRRGRLGAEAREQFLEEGYLRWDSLGEFFALAASFEHLAKAGQEAEAKMLADTLDRANGKFLENDKSPSRKVGGIDNRGSHFYLALYWAQA